MFNQMVELQAPELDATYAALAHDLRRDILARLQDGPARVTELARPYSMSLAAVSKHIRVLEEASLVRREVVGREHLLSLNPEPLKGAHEWLGVYRQFWDGRLDTLASLLRRRKGK
jgi:DNA-binding transcriptional ArsR family regulator